METSNESTGTPLNDLTLFAVDTLVSHSVLLDNETEQMTHDTFGLGLENQLAVYNRDTQSWRMSEDTSLWGDYKLLESLPKSGMTRNGVLFQQAEWERIISATESLSWPTPRSCTAMGATITPESAWNEKRFPNLETMVGRRKWPTPVASGGLDGGAHSRATMRKLDNTPYEVPPTGKLNPQWVEWLMGFPIGWTDLED
jgi:hypothetical protein